MTPDQRLGSPGVRLTKMPWGQACLRPALRGDRLWSVSGMLLFPKDTKTHVQLSEQVLPLDGGQVAHLHHLYGGGR